MSLEAVYTYTDHLGKTVAVKYRKSNRRFAMKAAVYKNGRMYLKGGRGCLEKYQPEWSERLLFNLPVVLDALRYGEPVFLVEGERDALALNTLRRLAATTSHRGARFFSMEQAEWFTTYKSTSPVHIIRDADDAGAFCAWQRYQRLIEAGVGPTRIHLWRPRRPAKDVTEALSRWGTRRNAVRPESLAAVTAIAHTLAAQRAARDYPEKSS